MLQYWDFHMWSLEPVFQYPKSLLSLLVSDHNYPENMRVVSGSEAGINIKIELDMCLHWPSLLSSKILSNLLDLYKVRIKRDILSGYFISFYGLNTEANRDAAHLCISVFR